MSSRIVSFGLSIDGFGAGRNRSLAEPLGVGGTALMAWAFATRTFQRIHGGRSGSTGVDEYFEASGFANSRTQLLRKSRRRHGQTGAMPCLRTSRDSAW